MNKKIAAQNAGRMNTNGQGTSSSEFTKFEEVNRRYGALEEQFGAEWEALKTAPDKGSPEWEERSFNTLRSTAKKMYQIGNEDLKLVSIDSLNVSTPVYRGLQKLDISNVYEILSFSSVELEHHLGYGRAKSLRTALSIDCGVTLFSGNGKTPELWPTRAPFIIFFSISDLEYLTKY